MQTASLYVLLWNTDILQLLFISMFKYLECRISQESMKY